MITFALPAVALLGFGLALFSWSWPAPPSREQLPHPDAEPTS